MTSKTLKNYYKYKHGRIKSDDIETIGKQFVKDNLTYEDCLSVLLLAGFDILTICKILQMVQCLRGEE